jgi:hypothetical protein
VIPRIFHHIWVGADPMPAELVTFRRSWETHHPGWEMRLWTEENLPADFRRREIYERLRVPAERSDMLRLEILHRHGGVYVDCDFECRRSIEPLLEGVELFSAWLKPPQEGKRGRVNNALIGARPGHPLFDRAIDALRPVAVHGLDKEGTGSLFWGRMICDCPEATIFPQELFYPPYASTAEQLEKAFAVHHDARSWKDGPALRAVARKAEERLRQTMRDLDEERRSAQEAKREVAALRAQVAALTPPPRQGVLARFGLALFRR